MDKPAPHLAILAAIIGAAVALSITALAAVWAYGAGIRHGIAQAAGTVGPATSCTTDTDCETKYPDRAARP